MNASKDILYALFQAALAAAQPDGKFDGLLPDKPAGRTIVIGAGKAAASMARAFEKAWVAAGHGALSGLVITRYGHKVATRWIEVVEAAHPVPDHAGEAAAQRILDLAHSAGPEDLVVCLISGGASALISLPAPGLTLADKQAMNRGLLKSAAPIKSINTVRKAMSAVKGGRLAAAAAPARLVTYIISDAPGDDPGIIGSGPTVQAPESGDDALAVLDAYNIAAPDHVREAIRLNAPPKISSSPVHMIATPKMALDAAAMAARRFGLTPVILGDAIEGEAREVGTVMAATALSVQHNGQPVAAPCVLLSGGETTVTMRGEGRGGRNSEFLLALALALNGAAGIAAMACDTDGIDGSEDNAGAWCDEGLLAAAREAGIDLRAHLAQNDAYTAFAALDRLVVTGPTLTNVNDFRAILIR